jgi:hypothetical protein
MEAWRRTDVQGLWAVAQAGAQDQEDDGNCTGAQRACEIAHEPQRSTRIVEGAMEGPRRRGEEKKWR